MITLDAPNVLGHCTFCDEIRVENTGRFLHIGVFPSAVMHVASFPFVLPRLGIGITYLQRPSEFFPPKFVFFLPGDPDDKPSVEAEIPGDAAREALAGAERLKSTSADPENAFASVHSNFNFALLPIAKSGFLKVRAVRGDKLFRLGSLSIEPAPVAS